MTLAFHRKSTRRKASLALLGVAAVCGALIAAMGIGLGDSARADHAVIPQSIEGSNPRCTDAEVLFGGGQTWKLVSTTDTPVDGEVLNVPGFGTITLTVHNGNPILLDWESDFGIDAVIIKNAGGPHNIYVYAPTGSHAEAFSGSGLQSQKNPQSMSHVDFCYDEAESCRPRLPETPTETPETPTETPETPTETPETPTSTPETPTSTPETPTSTPETPTSTPETPTSTPETPTSTPETPTATPETPTATPETPTPETPVTQVTQPAGETETASPTPIDTVAGVISTPAPPEAGSGMVGNDGSHSTVLIFLSLIALSAGAGSLALAASGRKNS